MQNKATKPTRRRQATAQTKEATLTTSATKARKPVKNKLEYKKRPILALDRSARKWRDDAIYMRDDEFRVLLQRRFRIIDTEVIGYNVSEDDETFEKQYEPIRVTIYGTDGRLTDVPDQTCVCAFYVRYLGFLWNAWDIKQALRIVDSIRAGLVLQRERGY